MLFSSRVYRKFRVLVVATLVISALAAGPALARRRQSTGSGVCLVTPNPVQIGTGVYTVWGSGFPSGLLVNIDIMNATGGVTLMAQVGADGTFGASGYAQFNSAGTEDVYVHDALDRQYALLGHCSFSTVY